MPFDELQRVTAAPTMKEINSPNNQPAAEILLEATNLGCVRGTRRLFSNVSFALPAGGFLELTGPNGSGKTSLLRIVCGLLTPAAGEIRWRGEKVQSLSEEYSQSLTYVGHQNALKDELNSLENLRIWSGLSGRELTINEARDALAAFGLEGREELPTRFLSQGQRRRSVLARLLVCQSKLWLLDEVLTSLDQAAASLMRKLLQSHLDRGGLAIVATHQELNLTAGMSQRLELAS